MGVLPGVIGTIQATEAIKCILGIGELLTNRLLTYNALRMAFREIPVRRNPSCPVCS
jgi:molybdopterin/thiamine biosynthesis adenylyltransferase